MLVVLPGSYEWQRSSPHTPITKQARVEVETRPPTRKLEQFPGVFDQSPRSAVVLSIAVDYFWTKLILL
ncbi:LANO_0B01376g1_1 [Lachancea nothofagi CBS 11611]|uniref:LANO_0B01376g1_1 n=1 Tax=Lachancea nothofagi CBS 11611 TaxID=1266666 RepID=A0A1G4IVR2_9SACH|nr:LANO_0B01376g1_1 [Lachancea nothofagi CBS 11611]